MSPNTERMNNIKGYMFLGKFEIVRQLLPDGSQEILDKLLIFAIQAGLEEAVGFIVSLGASVNACNEDGKKSALYIAVSKGHKEICEFLLDQGAIHDKAALFKAVGKQRLEIVKLLLDRGFDANSRVEGDGGTVLSMAIYLEGSKEIVESLLDHGADIDGRHRGKSILFHTVMMGSVEIVELLLKRGAHKDMKCIKLAASENNIAMVKLLLKRGFDVDFEDGSPLAAAIDINSAEMLRLLIDYGADIDNNESWNPISRAILGRNVTATRILLKHGANINVEDNIVRLVIDSDGGEEIEQLVVRHLVLLRQNNLPVGEFNWITIANRTHLLTFKNKCDKEIELLKAKNLNESHLSLWDFLHIKEEKNWHCSQETKVLSSCTR